MASSTSLWSRILAFFGLPRSTGEVAFEDDRVVLRDLKRAKALPQEPSEPGRKDMHACGRCGGPLRRVVFTTAGSGDQIEIWRQYPLALDGWLCRECGWSAMPRFITAEESVEYGREGSAHAANGQLDDAEFWFRRIIGSWPGYAPGYADLGQVASARADAAGRPEDKARHRAEAESWFRRAIEADPERRLPGVRIPLARTVALRGKEPEALDLLDDLLGAADLPEPLREEAEALATDLRAGKALVARAHETMGDIVLQPPARPLDAADRRALDDGRALLREAVQRKATFAALWLLGKTEMRSGDMDAALTALRRAHETDPDHPDGCRELAAIYLELGRAEEALPIARHALSLRPDDAGLRSNLALVLLLTGDVEGAQSEVRAALSRDPDDAVSRALSGLIEDVAAGRRERPRSLAEAEGRGR
jgi:tetratricopeptide (TPR) repeat protein